MTLRPGEIYYADYGDNVRHRAIIVSREDENHGNSVVVVQMTSKKFDVRSKLPTCVPFLAGEFGCTENCVARADMIGAMHTSKLQLDEGLIATLDDEKFREIIKAIGYVLNAECEPLD